MKKFWIFIMIAGVAIIAMSAINFLTRLGKGDPAPVFSLTTLEGKNISLTDFKGRPVIVSFFATWCPICQHEFPKLVKAFSLRNSFPSSSREQTSFPSSSREQTSFPSPLEGEGQGEGGLVVLAISEDTDRNALQNFLNFTHPNFEILLDDKGKIADSYQSFGLPDTFFINKDGIIEWRKEGPIDWGKLTWPKK